MTEKSIKDLCAPISARKMPEATKFSAGGRPMDPATVQGNQRKSSANAHLKVLQKLGKG